VCAPVRAQHHAQAGRVHELDPAQIEDHELRAGIERSGQPLLELRTRWQVELAADGHQRHAALVVLLCAEIAVHG
jgi:hypothetical protein